MKRSVAFALLLAVAAGGVGCASDNRLVGHRMTRGDQWYGEFGIFGNLNDITVLRGSRLTYLKIAGDGNKVMVEDSVPVGKIEIWGSNNTISISEALRLRDSIVGHGNRIIRRPIGAPQEMPLQPLDDFPETNEFPESNEGFTDPEAGSMEGSASPEETPDGG